MTDRFEVKTSLIHSGQILFPPGAWSATITKRGKGQQIEIRSVDFHLEAGGKVAVRSHYRYVNVLASGAPSEAQRTGWDWEKAILRDVPAEALRAAAVAYNAVLDAMVRAHTDDE